MAKFQVYKDAAGKFRFRLRADNNRIVAVGEDYDKHAGVINGIRSIKRNCNSPVLDTTVEGYQKLPNPKYEIYQDKVGKYRFRLKAGNGQIIAEGEGYESKDACLNGVEIVRTISEGADIDDSTIVSQPVEAAETSITGKMAEAKSAVTEEVKPSIAPDLTIESKIETEKEEVPTAIAVKQKEDIVATGEPTIEYGKKEVSEKAAEISAGIEKPLIISPTIVTPEAESIITPSIESPKKAEMLEELRKIRASVEAPPAPPEPKGFWNEFKAFLSKYGIFGVAIGLVLGIYLGILVQALVKDLLMPAIGLLIPDITSLAAVTFTFLNQTFSVGDFLVALITFIIVVLIVFIFVKIAKKWKIE